ncbi:MAG: PDZ domain-containing protein [Caldilineaceae bacterium]|nr:PDZ domain-containing protein [Caldilineaceae bacterium]
MAEGYYRYPTIHRDVVIFVSEDDLWQVSRQGGAARRLTSNLGEVTYPVLSPDGAWLAFVGREEGNTEVYVMQAEGGRARRLTYLNSNSRVVGWTPDGQSIIFATNYGQIAANEYGLFTVAYDNPNGTVTPLPYGPARTIAFGPQGQVVVGRNTQDPAYWKRYRGGTTGHLWLDDKGEGLFRRFLDQVPGNIASPMWLTTPTADGTTQERIFLISDHEGIGNLYSCLTNGNDLRRHTDHEDFYVRNPTTDGATIVYHAGGQLYGYDLHRDTVAPIPIAYYSPRVQRNRRFVDATRYWDSVRLHPSGKAMALTTRGKAFAFFNHEGPVLQYGKRTGVRYRLPEWSQDKEHLILISDELGEEALEIHPLDPQGERRRLEAVDIGRAVSLKLSPVQELLAVTNHRHELLLVDLQTETVTVVDRSPHRPIAGFDWSPDGRWLAYGYGVTDKTTAIRLYRLADPMAAEESLRQSAVFTVTQPILHDINPAFDPAGNYLYFLSYREFNPVYDGLHFELGFPWGMRPYLITLRADLPNPFIPQPEADDEGSDEEEEEGVDEEGGSAEEEGAEDELGEEETEGFGDEEEDEGGDEESAYLFGWRPRHAQRGARRGVIPSRSAEKKESGDKEKGEKEKEDKGKRSAKPERSAAKVKPIHIDLAGIERRILPFPVPDGRYGQIAGMPNKAIFTVFPIHGTLDDGNEWEEEIETGTLRSYNFKEYKSETLADDVSSFQLADNRKKLLYVSHRRLRVLNAGEKPLSETGSYRRTGWIDLYRIKVSVDPQSEWEQMFREAWRLQRDHFWTADMSEVDWQMVYQRYFPIIERVSTRSEFSDLMWEMQGELGTSHAYEYGGDYRGRPYYNQGFLGTTFTWDAAAAGYRIGELIIGDPWDIKSTSPLAAPGVDIQPGDLLLAINGQRLDAETGPAQLLVNQAGQEVLLTLASRPVTNPADAPAETTMAADEANDTPAAERRTEIAIGEPTSKVNFRSAVVGTIEDEMPARYRTWIEHNRQRVHELTNGRVGYVHIPDMGVSGYAEFHRGYLAEVDRDALIVDVRYNAGGNVSQLLLEKLARRRLGYDLSRWGGLSAYPADSIAGPLVAITNEHAGSDGDIFCHSFKLMKLGPLIGKRTWGGVVGISPQHTLVDGTVTTQPEYSFWFQDVGWNVENHGAEPDIEVDITPQDYRSGRDPQLERAIEEIMQRLAEQPLLKPDLATRPSRALPKLPPRLERA